jgi:hypothetical protein
MGDKEGNSRGAFLILDQDLKPKGTWSTEESRYGYDFWWVNLQPDAKDTWSTKGSWLRVW